ncbi:molybdopterin synthase catalytic subunit MoaE [Gynuella sunshinyii]|uniref:Molybdopterin synthase catalytic subunit n=1 Tax=Gynuella sunshinyii YC6258 TaxID=1445510 RepID=A0A0C5VTE5_9GAMM|nr:molybdopterin synthase catalytic subunit MoaE [Gynuella sunshinyii]AJQ93589.1 molybdopterin converting factor, large subunit [Gynuella sunshinyii YC6258]
MTDLVLVQVSDFSVDEHYQAMVAQNSSAGAVVFFVGRVRDFNEQQHVTGLYLEHYPGMTEKTLHEIILTARQRWSLEDVRIVHRVGALQVSDQIVFVGVSSAHRQDAFLACEFLMDFLKTKAPFWKKETGADGEQWLDARDSDEQSAQRW